MGEVDEAIVEGEVVGENLPAVRQEAQALVSVQEMEHIFAQAAAQAKVIAHLLRTQNLIKRIGQSDHVLFEGWVPVATANGKRLDTVETRMEGTRGGADFTSVACVGLRDIRTGEIVAKAWASCSRRESNWRNRDDYAIESMAQTRAGGKVCRMVYGWILALEGLNATPAEEMPADPSEREAPKRAPKHVAEEGTPQSDDEPRDSASANGADHQALVTRAAFFWQRNPKSAKAYVESHKLGMSLSRWTDAELAEFADAMKHLG